MLLTIFLSITILISSVVVTESVSLPEDPDGTREMGISENLSSPAPDQKIISTSILSLPPTTPNPTCGPGFKRQCQKARCVKKRKKTRDVGTEGSEDSSQRLSCTETKYCPNGRKCRCLSWECIPDTGVNSTIPTCRCPCDTGPCPQPCQPGACTLQACDPPRCL